MINIMITNDIKKIGAVSLIIQKRYSIDEKKARAKYPLLFDEVTTWKFNGTTTDKEMFVLNDCGEENETKYLKHKFINKPK